MMIFADAAEATSNISQILLLIVGVAIAICPILIFVRLGELIDEVKKTNAFLRNIDANAVTAINRVTTENADS